MKYRILLLLITLVSTHLVVAQSKTTQRLQEKYNGSFSLFFYNNTLRMINQQEDEEFDEIIRNIEKMKLLIIKKSADGFDFKGLVKDYKAESFEEIMTSRHQGKTFDIYLKERNGQTKAMLVLVNDDENLFVLDILGSIAFDKVTKLYSVMDESSDIGKKINNFITKDKKKEDEKESND